MPGVPVPFDEPSEWFPSVIPRAEQRCPKGCQSPDIWWREHESSDGAFEDTELKCRGCNYTWWIDGIDS